MKQNIYLNESNCPSGTKDNLKDAIKVWNKVETSRFKYVYKGTTDTTYAEVSGSDYSGDPLVFCVFDTSGSFSGITNVSTEGAQIVGAVIRLNYDDSGMGRADDDYIKAVMIHEFGHMLGLGHSDDDRAIMSYGRSEGEILAQDDVDGITYLYPVDELEEGFLGCGRVDVPPSPPNMSFLIIFLPLLMLFRLRLRQKRVLVYAT